MPDRELILRVFLQNVNLIAFFGAPVKTPVLLLKIQRLGHYCAEDFFNGNSVAQKIKITKYKLQRAVIWSIITFICNKAKLSHVK